MSSGYDTVNFRKQTGIYHFTGERVSGNKWFILKYSVSVISGRDGYGKCLFIFFIQTHSQS